jgi:hypothetical protein
MFKEIRLKQNVERDLLVSYGDEAIERYHDRDNFEEDVRVLVGARKTGIIIEKDDFNDLREAARECLPKITLII